MHTSLKLQMLSAAAALVIGGGVAQADYADTVLADNPLAYYRMQETDLSDRPVNAATGLTDNTTYGFSEETGDEGSTANLAHAAAGPITGGTALSLNNPRPSNNSEDFGFLDVDLTGWGNNYTAEMWFKVDSLHTTHQYLFTRTTADPGTAIDATSVGDAFAINSTGQFFLYNELGVTEQYPLISSTTTLAEDTWYYAALTRDGDTLTLYIKELLIDEEGNRTAGLISDSISQDRPIGAAADGTTTASFGARRDNTANFALRGDIAEVAIYNTALTEGQADAHFAAAIPEPGSLLLLGAGATMMLYRRRTVS